MDAENGYHEDALVEQANDEWETDNVKIWLNHTQMSGQVDKLFTALAKAQGEMGHAAKREENEFYGSKYADLAACVEAIRQPLYMNGLCIVQSPAGGIGREAKEESDYDSFPATVCLDTVIGHVSGQWISSSLTMRLVRDDPHGVGSAITYARRYALASMLGLAQADDDGNAATVPNHGEPAKKAKAAVKKTAKKGAKKKAVKKTPTVVLNGLLSEAGCKNKNDADMVCGWLFDDRSLTVEKCRENDVTADVCMDRLTDVVASGVPLDEFLTRATIWRDETQEETKK